MLLVALEDALRRVPGERTRRARGAHARGSRRRLARLDAQVLDPERPGGAAVGRDRELDGADAIGVAAAARAPREPEAHPPQHEALPVPGGREVAPAPPPDVRAARVDELHLELGRRGLAAQREGHHIVGRELERDVPARDGPGAVPREGEVEAELGALAPALDGDARARALRRVRGPAVDTDGRRVPQRDVPGARHGFDSIPLRRAGCKRAPAAAVLLRASSARVGPSSVGRRPGCGGTPAGPAGCRAAHARAACA